jgi:hypothetical protein
MDDPLLVAMDNVLIEENKKDPPRNYIGASGINGDCDRKIWLSYQGYKSVFKPDSLRAIADGHSTEEVINNILKKIPYIELHTHDENGNQYGFSDLGGKYRGHYDGVIRGLPKSPNTWHIYEVKCTNEKSYNQLAKIIETYGEENALKEWNPTYYGQAVTYMWYEKLTRHVTFVSKPGGRGRPLVVRTKQNHTFAKQLRDKAEMLLNMKDAPEKIGGENYFKCKMCGFYEVCHR